MGNSSLDPLKERPSDPPRPPGELRLSRQHWEQMRSEVDRIAPEEACGLVAGKNGRTHAILSITNILHSPVRYRMAPQEQLEAFEWIDRQGLELLAIYHSHPDGPPVPSPTDIDEAYYPEAFYLIWSRHSGEWSCHAFLIHASQVREVCINLDEDL